MSLAHDFIGLLVRCSDAVQSCENLRRSTKLNIVHQHLLSNTVPGPAKCEDQPPRPKHVKVVCPCSTLQYRNLKSASHLTEAGSKMSGELTCSMMRDYLSGPPERL